MAAIGGRKPNVEITPASGTGSSFRGYLTNARFNGADSNTATFAQPKDFTFQGSGLQDDGGDTDAFFTFVDEHVGETVTIVYMPQGNETPSTAQPHWTATAQVQEFDGDFLGGDASTDPTAKNTFDYSWPCDARPTKITSETP